MPPLISEWCSSVEDVPEWLIQDLLPADSAILISGKAKRAYKSWLAFQIAICVASGTSVGPLIPAQKGAVLILEAEGGRRQTRNRWEWLAHGSGVDLSALPIRFSHRENILLDDAAWKSRIKRVIAAIQPRLVIVDPLAMFSRGDENKVSDVATVMRALAEFREQGASVIFLHHLAKTQREWARDIDEEIRGTSAIAGFYDAHIALRQKRDDQDYNDLTIRSKDDDEKFFTIRWQIDKRAQLASFTMVPKDEAQANAELRQEVIDTMLPEIIYTQKRLQDVLGAPIEIVEQLLAELVSAGELVKSGRGYRLKETKDAP